MSPSKKTTIPFSFTSRVRKVCDRHRQLLRKRNPVDPDWDNGVFERFMNPVVTAAHTPLEWRYDFDPKTNPHFLERLGVNATLNPGAFLWNGKVYLIVRVEGADRKSFFAIAESQNGIDRFHFWPEPIDLPEVSPETNVYDMRITLHEDGWIYGLFCSESRNTLATASDLSSATAQAGVVRTRDFKKWERLPNLRTPSSQQRNVVLHPEFVNGRYALYTRPMDGFVDVGTGGGIGWTLCRDLTSGKTGKEEIIDERAYHTIKEVKNGQGPPPLKTEHGWLHLAHGVRNYAAGLRYVLYMFMTSLDDPKKIIARPSGHFLAPHEGERVGDVSNVVFSNGWVAFPNGRVLIYYGGSDTRCYVAQTTLKRLVDWCLNTPEDGLTTRNSFEQRLALIRRNSKLLPTKPEPYIVHRLQS